MQYARPAPSHITLLENVRFNAGEPMRQQHFHSVMHHYVMYLWWMPLNSARAHASTSGVAKYARSACAGLLLQQELDALSRAFEHPQSPFIAVVGGAKVSSGLGVLESLATKCDGLIVGGGIANTFIAAMGYDVGASPMNPTCARC